MKELCDESDNEQVSTTFLLMSSQNVIAIILGSIGMCLNAYLVFDVKKSLTKRSRSSNCAHNIYILQIGLTDLFSAFLRMFLSCK